MARATDVASYLVYLQNNESEKGSYYSLSNLKLQKMMYYCQGGHYKWDNRRLITDNEFEAWKYGPVISEIYHEYSRFGQNDIKLISIPTEEYFENALDDDERETISSIWQQLKEYNAFDLVETSHNETPWLEAKKLNENLIKEETIKKFFTEDTEGF